MVIRGNEISDRVKYWVKPDIENRIKEGSIKAYFNSTLKEIREKEVDISTPEGLVTLENDWVLAMTGYKPDLNFLRTMGIHLSEDEVCRPSYSESSYESNVKNIYLAGVICGGINTHRLFIENSREHAKKIIKDIVEKNKTAVEKASV
jgi:thioredoxin reductase (NADPH)